MKNKLLFLILIFSILSLFSFMLPNDASAVLTGTYKSIKYTGSEEITVYAQMVGPGVGQVTNTETAYSLNPEGSGAACSDALYYSIGAGGGGTYGTHFGFWVYKNKPLLIKSGALHVNTGVLGGSVEGNATGLAIEDPGNLAPEADDIQSLGPNMTINGQIKIVARDGGNTPINKNLIVGKDGNGGELKVWLFDACGTEVQIGSGNNRDAIFINNIYTWNQITVPGELYTDTKYTLRTNTPDDKYVDCTSGVEGGNKLSEQCKLTYFGSVDFVITKEKKIKIVGNSDGDWESKSNGRPFPIPVNGRSNGFNLTVTEVLDSPLDKALSSTIKWLANLVQTGLQVTMNWVDSLLNATDDYVLGDGISGNKGMEPAWTKIRNISLTLLVLVLIVIAFANVFQVNIEQYGLNRMIPKIIVAIIMAYMSWIIVIFFFDVANIIQAQANSFLGSGSGIKLLGSITIQTPTSADILAKMGAILVLIILLFGAWVCGIVLLFLLLLRIVMLSFLLAVAPMAMIANIMPFTSSLYKKWWNEFFKWMFMGPLATAIIALGTIIATNTGLGTSTNSFDESIVTNSATPGSGVNLLVGILILAASMYMAATLPLKWGGAAMGKWAGVGKKLWKNTGGKAVGGAGALAGMAGGAMWAKTGIPGAKKIVSNKLSQMGANSEARAGNRLANVIGLGTDPEVLKRQQKDASVTEASKQIGTATATNGQLHDLRQSAKEGSYKQMAVDRELASRGELALGFANSNLIDKNTGNWINADNVEGLTDPQRADLKKAVKADKRDSTMRAGAHLASLGGSDLSLENTVKEKTPEIFYAAAHSNNEYTKAAGPAAQAYAGGMKAGAVASQSGKSGDQKRTQTIEFMEEKDYSGALTQGDVKQIMGKNGDKKRQGHLDDFVKSGHAPSEIRDAYYENGGRVSNIADAGRMAREEQTARDVATHTETEAVQQADPRAQARAQQRAEAETDRKNNSE